MGSKIVAKTNVYHQLAKEEYINRNLMRRPGEPVYTLRDLALDYGWSAEYVKQLSASGNWRDELVSREEKIREESKKRMNEIFIFDELEIRTRQISAARVASDIALRKLKSLIPEDGSPPKISTKDAIALLKLGLEEERAAAMLDEGGLGELANPRNSASGAALSDEQIFRVARAIIDTRQGEDGEYRADDDD